MARTKDMAGVPGLLVVSKASGLGAGGQGGSRLSSLLPLWEKVAREARRMRGLSPRIETPHPARRCFASAIHPLPQGERVRPSLWRMKLRRRGRHTAVDDDG